MKNRKSGARPRIGLVGYGYWGPNLLRNLVAHGGCDVVGVVEPHSDSLGKARKVYPHVPGFSELATFLKEARPDAVVIATPPATHREVAVACLEAGAHVLVEKPLALSTADCDEILAAASKRDLQVMVDHTFAYHPAIQYVSDQIATGQLGDLLYYDSVRVNLGGFQPRTNVLWDLAPHDLSILDLFTGGKTPTHVSAVGIRHFGTNVENLCYVHLTYPDRFVAHLHLNWVAPVKIRTLMVGGTRKMAVYDENSMTEKVKIYDKGVSIHHEQDTPHDFRVSYRTGDMTAPAISNREALASMIAQFVDAVTSGKASVSDGLSGRRVVQILEAASLSMSLNGAPIEVGKVVPAKRRAA